MNSISVTAWVVGCLAVTNIIFHSTEPLLQAPSGSAAEIAVAPTREPVSSPRADYVGDGPCVSCHREKSSSFQQTAHYLTSRLPDNNSILGNFTPGANALVTSNPDLSFRMDAKETGFFETAVQGISPYVTERTERFGLVIGSGGKGQTYLFWKGDLLFQLPISYWKELGWVNSPGYRDGVANFDRPVVPRCLECHATYFEASPPPPNRYARAGFIVGITCEKCHGPGREHVQRENSKPPGSSGSNILNPAGFSRDRQMDLCAWCHAGAGMEHAPAFSYLPGEALSQYLEFSQPDPDAPVDVHGSQVELLEKSRCFQASAMTCLTCHDVHTRQHDLAAFTQRCLSCHKPATAMFPKLNHQIGSDCIGCHMPKQETNLIVFDWKGRKARPQVRSHWIRVYRAITLPNSRP
ncbi:MAG: multiheme c-type cytochrome [Candidatus Sulfotelmatobacter sp.]